MRAVCPWRRAVEPPRLLGLSLRPGGPLGAAGSAARPSASPARLTHSPTCGWYVEPHASYRQRSRIGTASSRLGSRSGSRQSRNAESHERWARGVGTGSRGEAW